MYDQILVPVGPDPSRKATLEHAIELAEAFGARVHLLHVADIVDRGALAEGEEAEGEAHQALEGAREAVEAAGLATREEVREGTPYEEIIAYVDERDVDLVVMGTHGKSGLSRVLLGSTAEEVVRRSPVPVVTVKG